MSEIAIEHTPIWADIKDVLNSKFKATRFEYRGMLHTEKEDLVVLKIDTIDLVRDFVNSIGDLIWIEFKMPLGEYMTRLYPFRTNLEFTIKRIALIDEGDKQINDSKIITTRYKAVFLIHDNPNYTATNLENLSTETLNNKEVLQVKLQLLNRSLEPIRIKSAQGVFKQVTQKKLIHAVLAGESLKVQIDGKPAIDGIDIVEPDNNEVRKHVVLPSDTSITTIPSFLQEKMGGVYNCGIGTYLQSYSKKMIWFVYPTSNTKRFKTSKDNKVIFYALPEGRFSSIERTYHKEASILKVLVTGPRKYDDTADIDSMNQGSGFRMSDARAFMKKPVEITPDGPKARRSNLNTEVAVAARKDGLNHAPLVKGSSNPFKEYSAVNARNVSRVDITWENADPELIYPGMPCRYIFQDQGKSVELDGTVAFVHSVTQVQGQSLASKLYITNCIITLICEQKPQTRKLPKTSTPSIGNF